VKIVVTGSNGLLGWHTAARVHARNCAAAFRGEEPPYDLVRLDRAGFENPSLLKAAVNGADAVLHFAGVNRGDDNAVEKANPDIATALVKACQSAGSTPHIIYANSIHAEHDTPYGRSKRLAAEILARGEGKFTNLILPHIFGECAKPFYNNVTATLIHQIWAGKRPEINPDGMVHLLHAGKAGEIAVSAALQGQTGDIRPAGTPLSIPDLWERLAGFHESYQNNIFPRFDDSFDLNLFNSYRMASYPEGWPRQLTQHSDNRGTLFEAVKCGGGQTFMSTTNPGVIRGDHFHLHKVERFLVLQGQATIRIRKIFSDNVWEYQVDGKNPSPVDMPTLHTHSIQNTGKEPLLTLFWTHDLFDPDNPDTFFDKVLP